MPVVAKDIAGKVKRIKSGRTRHPVTGCRVDTIVNCVWLIDPMKLESLRDIAMGFDLKVLAAKLDTGGDDTLASTSPPYRVNKDGVATVFINGPMTKYQTSFQEVMGGTSTLRTQMVMRKAANDPDVKAILLNTDTPGGTFHGTSDLADEVRTIAARKPVIMFGNGQVCSGGMMVAAQAGYRIATPGTYVGSVGTKCVLYDKSEAYSKMGVKVIPVTAGKLKAAGEDGTKITAEVVSQFQKHIDEINDLFVGMVSRGTGLSAEQITGLEADIFLGEKAKEIGLIHEVGDELRAYAVAAEAVANPTKYLFTDAAKRDPAPVDPPVAPKVGADSPANRSRTMLTAEQIAQAKQLPGAENITPENADTVLLGVATKLQTASAPLPKAEADRHVKLAVREIDLLVKEEKMLPVQKDALVAAIKAENVQSNGTVLVAADDVFKVFDTNKPSGLVDEKSGDQAHTKDRDVPGEDDANEDFGAGNTAGMDAEQAAMTKVRGGKKATPKVASAHVNRLYGVEEGNKNGKH